VTNRVVDFDIDVDDVDRAIAFYQSVFGWTIQNVEWMDYWLIKTGEGEPGFDVGLGSARAPRRAIFPSLGTTVDVGDVNAAFAAALAAGGTEVHQPGPIPGVGYMAYVRDTEGNHLGLMQRDSSAK
jgi:predicted enzyme related to lactoylglutathione lyase